MGIDTDRFLIGLLKYAGLSGTDLARFSHLPGGGGALDSDRDELVSELLAKGIRVPEASRTLYRELRSVLSKLSDSPFSTAPECSGKTGHRTEALKAKFAEAEETARRKGKDCISPAHLLDAILKEPTRAIRSAFRNLNMPFFGQRPEAFDAMRENVVRVAQYDQTPPSANAPFRRDDPLLMVLEREFRAENGKNILLVNFGKGRTAKRIEPLPRYLNEPARSETGNRTASPFSLAEASVEMLDRIGGPKEFHGVCREISSDGRNILFFDFLHRFFRKGDEVDFMEGFSMVLRDNGIGVLAGIDRYRFAELAENAPEICGLFTVIRVRDERADDFQVPISI